MRSACCQISAAVPRRVAEARSYSVSGMPEPIPAPDWTKTWWPRCTSTCTPAGIIPTRYSRVFISVGTPIFIVRNYAGRQGEREERDLSDPSLRGNVKRARRGSPGFDALEAGAAFSFEGGLAGRHGARAA